jgi:hypothetical protein
MTIREGIREGFHYARTCKSLWLFGFIVGIASGGSSGGGRGSGGGSGADGGDLLGGLPFALSIRDFPLVLLALIAVVVIAVVVALIVRFVSEGALIEGVVRARQGGRMTMGEGFRAGWAHWGVLLRVALLYVAAIIGTLGLLVVPCVLAYRAFGVAGGLVLGVPALLAAVPCLITLHLVQAFASRIAVIENRHAIDAIRKARLFLHGRIRHGLKLVVATLIGTIAFVLIGVATVVPAALLVRVLMTVIQLPAAILIAGLALVPVAFVVIAMMGTFRSSVWTVGYLSEVSA